MVVLNILLLKSFLIILFGLWLSTVLRYMGHKRYSSCIISVKNSALRFFMGVGRYTPNLSLYRDMDWIHWNIKQWIAVFRKWSRVTKICNDRINKKVFLRSKTYENGKIKNWSVRVKAKLKSVNMDQFCEFDRILEKSIIWKLAF